ncbi:MAG: hypothetical protein ACI8VW_000447 [bacterium]|jgi:hypothetical protein
MNSSDECTPKLAPLLGELSFYDQGFLVLSCQLLYFPFTLTRCRAIILWLPIDKLDRTTATSIASSTG